ncbi:hypothetical protein MLD38_000013 [Melastoma candidum]|uniref:Uncharacterized protein n=1 Tax=Melastoma candidum TaxID=119954 RepID=A0ACB9SCM9_9MYRT|nr:hypothetical protein MLD38_000013 [Melastoma candidum]
MTSDSSLKMGEMSTRTSSNVGKFRVTAARAESGKVSLGFRAPQFELTEPLSGKSWKLEDFEGYPALLINAIESAVKFSKGIVEIQAISLAMNMLLSVGSVMFICNHCPFVKHLKKDIVKLTNFYMKKGLAVVAISSNSISTHPQDGPDFMAQETKAFNYPFPYLYDEVHLVGNGNAFPV